MFDPTSAALGVIGAIVLKHSFRLGYRLVATNSGLTPLPSRISHLFTDDGAKESENNYSCGTKRKSSPPSSSDGPSTSSPKSSGDRDDLCSTSKSEILRGSKRRRVGSPSAESSNIRAKPVPSVARTADHGPTASSMRHTSVCRPPTPFRHRLHTALYTSSTTNSSASKPQTFSGSPIPFPPDIQPQLRLHSTTLPSMTTSDLADIPPSITGTGTPQPDEAYTQVSSFNDLRSPEATACHLLPSPITSESSPIPGLSILTASTLPDIDGRHAVAWCSADLADCEQGTNVGAITKIRKTAKKLKFENTRPSNYIGPQTARRSLGRPQHPRSPSPEVDFFEGTSYDSYTGSKSRRRPRSNIVTDHDDFFFYVPSRSLTPIPKTFCRGFGASCGHAAGDEVHQWDTIADPGSLSSSSIYRPATPPGTCISPLDLYSTPYNNITWDSGTTTSPLGEINEVAPKIYTASNVAPDVAPMQALDSDASFIAFPSFLCTDDEDSDSFPYNARDVTEESTEAASIVADEDYNHAYQDEAMEFTSADEVPIYERFMNDLLPLGSRPEQPVWARED